MLVGRARSRDSWVGSPGLGAWRMGSLGLGVEGGVLVIGRLVVA